MTDKNRIISGFKCKQCGEEYSVRNATPNEPCPRCKTFNETRFKFEQNERCEFVRYVN